MAGRPSLLSHRLDVLLGGNSEEWVPESVADRSEAILYAYLRFSIELRRPLVVGTHPVARGSSSGPVFASGRLWTVHEYRREPGDSRGFTSPTPYFGGDEPVLILPHGLVQFLSAIRTDGSHFR